VFTLLQALRLKEEAELDVTGQLHQLNATIEVLRAAEVRWHLSTSLIYL